MTKHAESETALGFGSLKELARGSRQAISSVFGHRSSHSSGREASIHHDQVIRSYPETPPRSYKGLDSPQSNSSSIESQKPEHSSFSVVSSQPTTPALSFHLR